MSICPPKKGPLAESSGYNKLVKDIEKEYKVDTETASGLADHAFFSKGDMPSFDEAKVTIDKGYVFTEVKSVKKNIKDLFNQIRQKTQAQLGYQFGVAEGITTGAIEQAKVAQKEIDALNKKLSKNEITRTELEDRVKELGYNVTWEAAAARLGGEIAGKKAGRKEGKAEQVSLQKEFAAKVGDYLKSNEKLRGRLSEKQIDSITRKAAFVGTSDRAFAKLTDYVDKVIANENYAKDVSDAKSLQGKLKKTFAESEAFMNRMKKVDVENISQEDLNAFNEMAKEYVDSQKTITGKAYAPFDLAKNESILQDIEKNISEKTIADIEKKYDVYDLTEEQATVLNEYMSSEDPDLYFQNLDDAKKKSLTENINKIASYSQMGLKETLPENEQFFNDNYGNQVVGQLKEIANADLSKITDLKDLATVVKTIDNSITNKTNSNVGAAHATVKSYENITLLEKATSSVKKFVLKNFGKLYYDTPIVLKGIFGNREVAAKIRYYTGWDGITNAASSAETIAYKTRKEWDTFRKSIKLGDSAEEDAIMGIYSRLNDVRKGNADIDFQNEKKQLESSIDALMKSDKEENKFFGQFLKNIYEQSVKDFNTHKEFSDAYKNTHPLEVKGVEWISDNIWKKNEKDFRNHSESNLNRTYDGEARDGYHAKRYTSVREETKVGEPDEDVFEISSKKPQETGRSKDRILEGTLPKNKVVDYRFEYNSFKNYQEVLFEMGSYHDKLMFSKMSGMTEQWDALFGGNKNAAFVSHSAEQQYKMLRFGKKNADRLSKTWFVSLARTLKNAGSVIGLARVSQVLSQTTPAINTMFQASKHFYDVMTTKGLKDIELFNQSSIGARGLELGAIGRAESTESLSYDKLKKGFSGFMESVSRITGKTREFALKPLSGADVSVAKKSFLAFYLKYMNEVKGIKVKASDLPTEHLRLDDARKEALSYAQQSVDELQGVSNKALLSELKKNDNGDAIGELARTVLMPFNNFASNTRARIMEDAQKATFGNTAQKAEALKDLAGTAAEATAFSAINAFIVTGVLRYGLKSVLSSAFGIDPKEEDADKIISDKFKQFYTGISREMLISGFGGTAENVGVNALNYGAYMISRMSQEESSKDYYTWLKEEPLFKPQYSAPPASTWYEAVANNTGGYGIAIRTGQQTYEDISAGITGKATSSYGYEKMVQKGEKETTSQFAVKENINIGEQDKNLFLFLGIMEGMSLLGVSEQDVTRAAQAVKYDVLRKNKPTGGSKSPFSKGLGGGGFKIKGL